MFWYLGMLCMGIWIWGHPYSDTPSVAGSGWILDFGFGIMGVDLSLCDAVMSWLRLQQASDWIPHYTKCFGTLICWVWAYGTTLTTVPLCRSRVDFSGFGGKPEPV